MDPPIKLNKTHNFPSDLADFSARFLITLSSRRPEERMEDISLQDSEDMDSQLYFERSVLEITTL